MKVALSPHQREAIMFDTRSQMYMKNSLLSKVRSSSRKSVASRVAGIKEPHSKETVGKIGVEVISATKALRVRGR